MDQRRHDDRGHDHLGDPAGVRRLRHGRARGNSRRPAAPRAGRSWVANRAVAGSAVVAWIPRHGLRRRRVPRRPTGDRVCGLALRRGAGRPRAGDRLAPMRRLRIISAGPATRPDVSHGQVLAGFDIVGRHVDLCWRIGRSCRRFPDPSRPALPHTPGGPWRGRHPSGPPSVLTARVRHRVVAHAPLNRVSEPRWRSGNAQ